MILELKNITPLITKRPRMYKNSIDDKEGRVNVRYKKGQKDLIARAVRLAAYPNMATFIREATLAEANKIIAEYDSMVMVTGDYSES